MEYKDDKGNPLKVTPINTLRIDGEDNWIRIHLEDGAIVKFKPIVLKVVRLPKANENSDFQYIIESQNVASVEKQPTEVPA